MESHEQELQSAKQDLEIQLESVMRQSQEALLDRQVELNKSKLYNQTLEKRYEVSFSSLSMLAIPPVCKQMMKSKQPALLMRLDILDEECTALKEELVQVESNREKLACDLQQVQADFEQVQQQLNTERVGIHHSGGNSYSGTYSVPFHRTSCQNQTRSRKI